MPFEEFENNLIKLQVISLDSFWIRGAITAAHHSIGLDSLVLTIKIMATWWSSIASNASKFKEPLGKCFRHLFDLNWGHYFSNFIGLVEHSKNTGTTAPLAIYWDPIHQPPALSCNLLLFRLDLLGILLSSIVVFLLMLSNGYKTPPIFSKQN